MLSVPGPMEGKWAGWVVGPFGLHMEPEKILNFCCCLGTNLYKEARMTPGHNVFAAPVQVHVTV